MHWYLMIYKATWGFYHLISVVWSLL